MIDPNGPLPETGTASVYRWIPSTGRSLPMPDSGREVMALIDANPPGISSARLIAKSGMTSPQVHKQLLALRSSGFIVGVNRHTRAGYEIQWTRAQAEHPSWSDTVRDVVAALQDHQAGLSLDELSSTLWHTPTTIIHILLGLQESGHVVRTAPGVPLPSPEPASTDHSDAPLYASIESIVNESPVGLILPTVAVLADGPQAEVASVLHRLYDEGRIGGVRYGGNTDLMLWLPRRVSTTVQAIVDSVAGRIEGATIDAVTEDVGLSAADVEWQLEALRDHLLVDNLRIASKDGALRWFLVRHTSRRQYRPRPAPAQALALVHERPGLNCPQLAELLDCSPTYLSVQLRALRKAGHVRWDRGSGPTIWFPL